MRGRKPNEIAPGSSPVLAVPKPPAWLSKDAKAEWRRVAPILVERGVLTEADRGALEGYCTAMARVMEAERIIRVEGQFYAAASGPKRHPAATTQDAALKTARLFMGELGLTPDARSRSTFKVDDGNDSALDF